jgi:hypothetical protein
MLLCVCLCADAGLVLLAERVVQELSKEIRSKPMSERLWLHREIPVSHPVNFFRQHGMCKRITWPTASCAKKCQLSKQGKKMP